MLCSIFKGDITKIDSDAIVNAASSDLKRCPGICDAIFSAADTARLEAACNEIGHCPIGEAVITESFGLPAKYIVHVAGPGWFGGTKNEKIVLKDCYRRSMELAWYYGCKKIAIPLMFSGGLNVSRSEAIKIAGCSISRFVSVFSAEVVLVLYNAPIFNMAKQILKWETFSGWKTD